MTRDQPHHFHLYAGDSIVSRYLTDGPEGRRGDPVLYREHEVEAAGLALTRALGVVVTARCVMGEKA